MQKCTLHFKSFNFFYIKNSYKWIEQFLAKLKIASNCVSFISQPHFSKKYTLLRSPHIHKKSREQFEWSRRKGVLTIVFKEKEEKQFLLFLFWLQNSQFPGVQVTVVLNFSTIFYWHRYKYFNGQNFPRNRITSGKDFQ